MLSFCPQVGTLRRTSVCVNGRVFASQRRRSEVQTRGPTVSRRVFRSGFLFPDGLRALPIAVEAPTARGGAAHIGRSRAAKGAAFLRTG